MKLNEKGLGKLYNSKACYYDPDTEEEVVALSYFEHVFEFEPDDFVGGCCQNGKDHIVLTVEEARRLHDCAMFFWDDYEGTQYFTNDDKRFLTDMRERIEQATKEGRE